VTTEDASFLDGKHTIFWKVIDGMDVVDEIESLPTDAHDRPKLDAIIESTKIL
jgi:cyclophilin family peptidyl-prolyl cis-trans isomerase